MDGIASPQVAYWSADAIPGITTHGSENARDVRAGRVMPIAKAEGDRFDVFLSSPTGKRDPPQKDYELPPLPNKRKASVS